MIDAEMIVPGEPDESELILRMTTTEPEERMPREHKGAMFLENEVNITREWIANGAPAPEAEKPEAEPQDHWAYQKNQTASPTQRWCDKNQVDALTHSKLQEVNSGHSLRLKLKLFHDIFISTSLVCHQRLSNFSRMQAMMTQSISCLPAHITQKDEAGTGWMFGDMLIGTDLEVCFATAKNISGIGATGL